MNRVIHFEIHATNAEKLANFYHKVFGWEIRKWENPNVDYWIVMTAPDDSKEHGINGGIVGRKGPMPKGGEAITSFICTIEVTNVDEYGKKIEQAGGKNCLPKMPIPGVGWLAYYNDIDGNTFGIMHNDKNAK